MPNPFKHRASEYQGNELEFLATLTPSLFRMTLDEYENPEDLLTRAVVFSAPPGTGKTTLSRFFQFATLSRLLDKQSRSPDKPHEDLLQLASEREFVSHGRVSVCGARVSLERDYRDLALLGYRQETADRLLLSLLGARAVLAWRRGFRDAGLDVSSIRVVPTSEGGARLDSLGGSNFQRIAERAERVESQLFQLTTRFVPPNEQELLEEIQSSFLPLVAISRFELPDNHGQVLPLLMMDDAHSISREQHDALLSHLSSREIVIGRWVLQRMEALDAEGVIAWGDETRPNLTSGLQRSRSVLDIRMTQSYDEARGAVRKRFRKAVAELVSRNIAQMPNLTRLGITIPNLEERSEPTDKQLEKLNKHMESAVLQLELPPTQVEQIVDGVKEYLREKPQYSSNGLLPPMATILLHRQFKRAPQRSLFDESSQPELAEEVQVSPGPGVLAGAQVHAWHRSGLPYLGGLDTLADLGSENAETALQLAWQIIRLLEASLIAYDRRGSTALSVNDQHEALRRESRRILNEWSFPYAVEVRRLVDRIARRCIDRSLEDTAPLGGGANAIGIDQEKFRAVLEEPRLREVLRFACGYNALMLTPGRKTKGRTWTLLELCGPAIAAHGLTTSRGGFIPLQVSELVAMVDEVE